jgi:putative flippase GtrA
MAGLRRFLREVLLFAFAGVLGFLADAGALYLLIERLGPYYARAISFFCAVVTTWLFNRFLTFRKRNSGYRIWIEFIVYLGSMFTGGIINLGVYGVLVGKLPATLGFPLLALVAGTLSGMVVNFVTSRYLLFRHSLEKGLSHRQKTSDLTG